MKKIVVSVLFTTEVLCDEVCFLIFGGPQCSPDYASWGLDFPRTSVLGKSEWIHDHAIRPPDTFTITAL